MHDISMMDVKDDEGKMWEARQACMREFDALERKFALESDRLG